MAFVNEYIREEDIEKYDLKRICGEHNLANKGHMYAQNWTVDHDREMFLLKTWSHRESEFGGWAFYWHGSWMFFERTSRSMRPGDQAHVYGSRLLLKGFHVPSELIDHRGVVVIDLNAAFAEEVCDGLFGARISHNVNVEFIKE